MVKLYWPKVKNTEDKNSSGRSAGHIGASIKPKKGMKISSALWLNRHSRDPYVKERVKKHYRSRAAFKLLEIDKKHQLLRLDMRVVDLGAAPGGWLQVLSEKLDLEKSLVIGIDLSTMTSIAGIDFIKGDITAEEIKALVKAKIPSRLDLVLSDLSPARTGHAKSDALAQTALAETALEFAMDTLAVGGDFLCKLLQGHEEPIFFQRVKNFFKKTCRVKPSASRRNSTEIYILGKSFLGHHSAS